MTRWRYGAMSLWSVNRFVWRVLHPRTWWTILLPFVLFALAIWLALKDYSTGAWLSFGVGLVGLLRECWSTLCQLFFSPPALIAQDRAFQGELLLKLEPSPEEQRDGYVVLPIPQHPGEAVVRSSRVDAWLRQNDVQTRTSNIKRNEVEAMLRAHGAGNLESVLRCRSFESYHSMPPRVFLDRRKFGLSSGIAIGTPSVRIHEIGYFHSIVSNEIVTRYLETDSAEPACLLRGRDLFPATFGAEHWTLWPIDQSRMADHVGASTLVVTRDKKLVVWTQSRNNQQSRELLAPTGSGSCDWADHRSMALKDTLARAMEREFVEESFGGQSRVFEKETRVVGYFRWVRRGGKPEFVGVTRADVDAAELEPRAVEVRRGNQVARSYYVWSLSALCEVLDQLHANAAASVPLWVNALALKEAVEADRAEWAQFLHLSPD